MSACVLVRTNAALNVWYSSYSLLFMRSDLERWTVWFYFLCDTQFLLCGALVVILSDAVAGTSRTTAVDGDCGAELGEIAKETLCVNRKEFATAVFHGEPVSSLRDWFWFVSWIIGGIYFLKKFGRLLFFITINAILFCVLLLFYIMQYGGMFRSLFWLVFFHVVLCYMLFIAFRILVSILQKNISFTWLKSAIG